MEITKPSLSTADTLVSLWMDLAESQRTFGSHILVDENEKRIRQTISQHIATGRVLVARDEAVRGFVTFTVEVGNYEQDVNRGIIENIYVVPECRNEGIGTALIEATETELCDIGVDVIVLEALAENDEARRFYRSHGYRPHRVELEKTVAEDS